MMRGIVMIIMAIDHTREFWGASAVRPEDVSQASVSLFFTRWVTHLCAPAFILLSGISLYLYQQQKQNRKQASTFAFTRGVWLIVIEILIMGPIITHGYNLIVLGIFWVIGASMILMSPLMMLPRWSLIALAIVMIAGHNLLPPIQSVTASNVAFAVFHNSPFLLGSRPPVLVAYTIVPWVAVMMLGYWMGKWFTYPEKERQSRLLLAAVVMLTLFVIIRAINIYGDPFPWQNQERGTLFTILSFINVTKYPPSLLFLCLMLGIALILLSFLEKLSSVGGRVLKTFGQVPFFFFILHFLIISVSSAIWSAVDYGKYVNFGFSSPAEWPSGYEPSLTRVYVVWIIVLVVSYFPCKRYSEYRKKNKKWWLSYV
jgi:uncharacterized membrane protein